MIEIRKSILTTIKEKLGFFPLMIIILLIILLFYYSISTQWIPTSKKINRTDIYNRTIELDGIYSYVYNQYIPKEKEFEKENLLVPKGSFEFEKALFIIFWVIILQALNLKQEPRKEPLSYKIIRKKLIDYLEEQKENKTIKDYILPMPSHLQKKQVDDGDKIPDIRWLPTEIKTNEGDYEYHMIGFDAFTGELDDDLKTNKEFKGEDTCPECKYGRFSNYKVLTPKGYADWYDKFEAPRRRLGGK